MIGSAASCTTETAMRLFAARHQAARASPGGHDVRDAQTWLAEDSLKFSLTP